MPERTIRPAAPANDLAPADLLLSATRGDGAYDLDALAGDRRAMACSFDPDLDWVRATWPGMELDPRIPLVPPRVGSMAG